MEPIITYLRTFAVAAAGATIAMASFAQAPAKDDPHHPQGAALAAGGMPAQRPAQPMAGMDEQMKVMQGMHEKMMQAKTPEERSALMAEHKTVMQAGMAMMDKGPMKGKPGNMADRQAMMEQRMAMTQSMMQMMMDHMQQHEQMAAPGGTK